VFLDKTKKKIKNKISQAKNELSKTIARVKQLQLQRRFLRNKKKKMLRCKLVSLNKLDTLEKKKN
jgi:hypothetical protein